MKVSVSAFLFLLLSTVAVPALADGPVSALEVGTDPLATPAVGICNLSLEDFLFASGGVECSPDGSFRFTPTGECCSCGREEHIAEKCISGQWVFIGIECKHSIQCAC